MEPERRGNWTVDFADMALVSADGSVRTLYNGGNVSVSPNNNYGMTNVQQSVATPAEPGTNGATYYYLSDHLGTTQMEIAAGGWPVWQGQFTPYGQEILGGGRDTLPVTKLLLEFGEEYVE